MTRARARWLAAVLGTCAVVAAVVVVLAPVRREAPPPPPVLPGETAERATPARSLPVETAAPARMERASLAPVETPMPLPAPPRVRGRVDWADGAPAPGVEVRVEKRREEVGPFADSTRADAEASFEIEFGPAEAVTLQAVYGEHHSPSVTVDAAHAPPRELALVLPHVPSVRGRLLTPDGRGAAGWIQVWSREGVPAAWSPRDGRRAETEATGAFCLDLPPGAYALVGIAADYASSGAHRVDVSGDGGRVDVRLRLRTGGTIRGVVVDEGGAPMAGIPLMLVPEAQASGGAAAALPGERPAGQLGSTGADGSFAFLGLCLDAGYRLVHRPRGLELVHVELGGLRAGQHDVRFVVRARDLHTGTLSGTVRSADGALLVGYEIKVGHGPWRRVPDAEGRFAIDGVPLGRAMPVLVRARGETTARLAGCCVARATAAPLDLRIAPPGALEIIVREADGTPAADGRVTLRHEAGGPASMVLVRSDGRASLPALDAGRYAVCADWSAGRARADGVVVVPAGGTAQLELRAGR